MDNQLKPSVDSPQKSQESIGQQDPSCAQQYKEQPVQGLDLDLKSPPQAQGAGQIDDHVQSPPEQMQNQPRKEDQQLEANQQEPKANGAETAQKLQIKEDSIKKDDQVQSNVDSLLLQQSVKDVPSEEQQKIEIKQDIHKLITSREQKIVSDQEERDQSMQAQYQSQPDLHDTMRDQESITDQHHSMPDFQRSVTDQSVTEKSVPDQSVTDNGHSITNKEHQSMNEQSHPSQDQYMPEQEQQQSQQVIKSDQDSQQEQEQQQKQEQQQNQEEVNEKDQVKEQDQRQQILGNSMPTRDPVAVNQFSSKKLIKNLAQQLQNIFNEEESSSSSDIDDLVARLDQALDDGLNGSLDQTPQRQAPQQKQLQQLSDLQKGLETALTKTSPEYRQQMAKHLLAIPKLTPAAQTPAKYKLFQGQYDPELQVSMQKSCFSPEDFLARAEANQKSRLQKLQEMAEQRRAAEEAQIKSKPRVCVGTRKLIAKMGQNEPLRERTSKIVQKKKEWLALQQRKKQDIKRKKEEQQLAEMEKSRIKPRKQPNQDRGEFYDGQVRWLKDRAKNVQQIAQKHQTQNDQACSFKPQISKGTQRILKKKNKKEVSYEPRSSQQVLEQFMQPDEDSILQTERGSDLLMQFVADQLI